MADRNEHDAMNKRARAIHDRLRRANLERTSPDGTTHGEFTAELKASMVEGEFALSAMLQLGYGPKTAALEWLNGERSGGYTGVSAAVLLKNIGSEPVHYCSRATTMLSPDAVKGSAKASVNGKLATVYDREYSKIAPGETKAIPVGKAVTLLMNHSALAYPANMRGRRSGPLVDVLREVGGQVVELGSEPVKWSLEEPAAPAPKARRGGEV